MSGKMVHDADSPKRLNGCNEDNPVAPVKAMAIEVEIDGRCDAETVAAHVPGVATSKPGEDNERDVAHWTRRAIQVSYVSIALTTVTGVVGLMFAMVYSSSAMLGYGLESFVDVVSSILVVWRFRQHVPGSNGQQEEHEYVVEKKANVGICFTFVAIAAVVGGQATSHLVHTSKPGEESELLVLAGVSCLAFAGLGLYKWNLSHKLSSSTLRKDAVCSLAVAVLSLAVATSAVVYQADDAVWWLDAAVALVTAILLFVYSSITLFCHGHRWWTAAFWKA